MIAFLVRRLITMVWTLIGISVLVFIIIQLPPGDYLSTYIAEIQAMGEKVADEKIAFLREQYGLDKPLWQQYLVWVIGLLHGDLGYSFEYNQPVADVIGDRLFLTMVLNFVTVLFIYVVSFPIGVYSATHQYSAADHGLSFLGFIGLATPNFLLALILLYLANVWFGTSIGGLMDPQYVDQPWSLGKALSVLEHLWVPVVVIGTSGTAGMIRRLRANLLDELQKQYVTTARAKGVPRGPAPDPLSAPHGAQSLHRRHRQPAAADRLELGHRLRGHVAADDRADAAFVAAEPGHVSRRLVPDVSRGADRHRHARLRHPARRARSRASGSPGARRDEHAARPLRLRRGRSIRRRRLPPGSQPSERYLNASQTQIIWWRFLRHRLAVVSLVFLGAQLRLGPDLRVHRALRSAQPPFAASSTRRRRRMHLFHEGRLRRAVRLSARLQAQHGDAEARIYVRPLEAAADPLLLLRRELQFLGPVRRQPSTSSARRRRGRCSCSAPTGSAATCSRG